MDAFGPALGCQRPVAPHRSRKVDLDGQVDTIGDADKANPARVDGTGIPHGVQSAHRQSYSLSGGGRGLSGRVELSGGMRQDVNMGRGVCQRSDSVAVPVYGDIERTFFLRVSIDPRAEISVSIDEVESFPRFEVSAPDRHGEKAP